MLCNEERIHQDISSRSYRIEYVTNGHQHALPRPFAGVSLRFKQGECEDCLEKTKGLLASSKGVSSDLLGM